MKKRLIRKLITVGISVLCLLIVLSGCAAATGTATDGTTASGTAAPGADAATGDTAADTGDEDALSALLGSRSDALQIVGLLTILSIAPSILLMVTCFTRIIVVLSFTRSALGLQQMPPNQVMIALAIFLTFFVMSPVFDTIRVDALEPYINNEITFDEAVSAAEAPIRTYMLLNTTREDMNMFLDFSGYEFEVAEDGQIPELLIEDVPLTTIIPAYITSELRQAFIIGFFIYIPFIVVDMVVASVLMAMGMMMLPPITISLPFKVLLFVLVDGWTLTIDSLLATFNVLT